MQHNSHRQDNIKVQPCSARAKEYNSTSAHGIDTREQGKVSLKK